MSVKGLKIKIKSVKDADARKVVCTGVIDGHTSTYFERVLSDVIENSVTKIVLDFTDVTYLSSAGVGVLISANGKLNDEFPDKSRGILIMNPSESVRDVFHILEIEDIFTFVNDEAEAEDALKKL